jgi:hypothetical protein
LVRVFYNSPLGQVEIGQATLTVVNGKPTLTSLTPNQALVGSASQAIALNGTGFINGATVLGQRLGACDDLCQRDAVDGATA